MAATITAAGTWTTLGVDFSKTPKTGPNTMVGNSMNLVSLKDADLPELTQFVQAMADGYGIPFNVAKQVFFHCVQAFMNRQTPTRGAAYAA
jgi:hypothetical protein